MNSSISDQVWKYVEKLYIHCYGVDGFLEFLKSENITLSDDIYANFEVVRFMSVENHIFSEFMRNIELYKSKRVLSKVVFNVKIQGLQEDSSDYSGSFVKDWYQKLIAEVKQSGFIVDHSNEAIYPMEETLYGPKKEDFVVADFNDPFLNHIKRELNECYNKEYYLSVMILSRKLFECLVVRLIEAVFPKKVNGLINTENHSLLCYKKKDEYMIHNFSILLKNLEDNALAFQEHKDIIIDICSLIEPFRIESNKIVHRDYRNPTTKDKVDNWDIPTITNMLWKLYRNYCS